jgi:phenylpropionate dioxygenase-like ring-hydroxylating dioxygenase large terminal subunit
MNSRTAHGAKTLPRAYYTSDAIFSRELDQIFSRRWLFAGHASKISEPGDFFLFEVGPESLIILQDRQDNVQAFYNVCRHSECYHCPTVHPTLNKLTPFRNSINDLDEGPFLGGPMQLASAGGSMTMTGNRCAVPLNGVRGDDLDRVYYYTIFPNLFLSLHPDYVLIHRGDPQGVGRTHITCEWYFHPDAVAAKDFDPAPAIEFWDMTNRQDWHLCTISQQDISSQAYSPGPYSNLESQLAAFDREYLHALGQALTEEQPV